MKSRRAARSLVAVAGLLVWLLIGQRVTGADAPAPPDPDNCTWNLTFEAFFPPDRRGPQPMRIYMVRRQGRFLHALGSSPTWNKCCHTVDISRVRFAEGVLSGTMQVTLHPDPWIPEDAKPLSATLEINAKIDLEQPGKEGSVNGSYQGTLGNKRVSGKLGGNLGVPEMTSYRACRFGFALMDALEGGANAWDRRMRVEFDVFDGKPTGGAFGSTDMRGDAKILHPLKFTKLEVKEHTFAAEFTIHYEILGAIGDASADYRFSVDGKRVNDLIGGIFNVTVSRKGHRDLVKGGGLKGWIRPTETTKPSIWAAERDDRPWFVPAKGFTPLKPGEHPRLFFRRGDLPELRRRAETPEGKAIMARLRATLGGGEAMPKHYSRAKKAYDSSARERLPEGAYTISHAAGFGFLYQLTGKRKYADLGRKCMELAIEGRRDRDDRYAWVAPGGELRAGPSIAWYAAAYDLCYDGWDPAFRKQVALMIQDYDDGRAGEWGKPEGVTLHAMAMSPKQPPGSNHFGSVVGGAGIAVLAILGDPGTDDVRLRSYLRKIEQNTVLALTKGFGDHGYFSENAGPSHVAANCALVPFLQAMKVADGKDYITPRPNAQWLTMRWVMEIVPDEKGEPYYPCRKPSNYGGPRLLGSVGGMSHGGWFSQGFGAVCQEQKPALLWVYDHFVAEAEGHRFTATNYPHRAVLAMVNWPIGVEPQNPAQVVPKAIVDKIHGYYVFRNRWKDHNDILVAALLGSGPTGHIGGQPGDVMVWGLGQKTRFGSFGSREQTTYYKAAKDGSGVVAGSRGNCLAVDFSGVSGADALLVMTGPGAEGGQSVSAGGTTFHIMTLQTGAEPEARAEADAVILGGQTIRFDGEKIILGKRAGP